MTPKDVTKAFDALPRESLGFFPTPFHKLEKLSAELGVELYIKRDDFSGVSLFGGNKIRKLEYLMGDAAAKGCDTVITFGATQSNHAMQTATACRRCGLRPILYLVSIVEPSAEDMRANLLLDNILGAEIHIIPSAGIGEEAAERQAEVEAAAHAARLEAEGHRCYTIPMGGASEVGSCGFIAGFAELTAQAQALGFTPDYLFVGTGTGGTLAGLAAGKKLTQSPTQIVAINVSRKDETYPPKVSALAEAALAHLGVQGVSVTPDDFTVDPSYYAPSYELPNPEANNAIRRLARTEGIFTDPVYSGKAFYGLLDHVISGKVPQGSRVVFWHTGGATALFAEREIIDDLAQPGM